MSSSAPALDQIFTPFFSKMRELLHDYSHNFWERIRYLKLNLESLQKSSMLLNAKASDVKERIKSSNGSMQKKRKREVDEWLSRVKSVENEVVELRAQAESEGFLQNLMDGVKIAQLNEEIVMLVEQSQHFYELLPHTRGTRGVEFLTSRMVDEEFKQDVKRIWTLLEKRKVSSIGIHGMCGVGKTVLAKCINNRLLKQSQVRVFWITVSQEFTIKSLQDRISSFLGLNLSDEDDEDIRARRLHRALSQMKNSVLILDDLWECIDLLKVGYPVSVECCRLIITTRCLDVCRQIRCEEVIEVRTLHEDKAWKLFIETLTPGQGMELGPHVEGIAKSMARLCGGVPLRIISVARRLRGRTSFHSWTSIHSWTTALTELKESLTRQDGAGDVEFFRALKYSFDRLNNQSQSKEFNLFQRCFLYCSFYNQDDMLHINHMVERFISEGLVDVRKSRREQVHQGRAILDYLVDVCLLEPWNDMCSMLNNLVRCMAWKIGEGKYMVRAHDKSLKEIPHEQEWTNDLEYVFLMCNDVQIIQDGTSPDCPNLSTLLLQYNPLRAIPDSFFSKMKRLSTLDLRGTHIKMLPNSVSNLTSLQALLLEGCGRLEAVPYLGKLKTLRELSLSNTAIKTVPEGVEELLNLQSLSMNATKLEMLPLGLLVKLVHLHIVKFPVEVLIPTEEIQNLKEVEQFYGRLNDVGAFNCFILNQQHEALYRVHVGMVRDSEFEPYSYSRELFISECNVEGTKVLALDIKTLTFTECEGLSKCLLDDFCPSSYPESLEFLAVERCGGIEWLLTSCRESPSHFSTLTCIVLKELEHFKGMIQRKEISTVSAVFSSLRSLTIENCNEMTKLGLPVLGAPNLEDITISKCGEIEEIFEDEGGDVTVTHPKLEELSLSELPRLKSVCNAKLIFDSIRKISIVKCPRLNQNVPALAYG